MSLASLTTNLPNGVTNAASNSAMGTLTQLDPTKVHNYFNDFNLYKAADWVVTVIETGTLSSTQTIIDQAGGILRVTTDDADNDAIFSQSINETFKFVSDKQFIFKTRISFNATTTVFQKFIVGLQIRDTTPLDASDGVYFTNMNTNAIDLMVTKNTTSSTLVLAESVTLATNNTFIELAFVYDGVSKIEGWLNDAKIGELDTTNLPDDEELTISFGNENTAGANQKFLDIDYIYAANER